MKMKMKMKVENDRRQNDDNDNDSELCDENNVYNDINETFLARHHPISGEWAIFMSEDYTVVPPFLDDRQNCPVPAYTPIYPSSSEASPSRHFSLPPPNLSFFGV